MGLAGNFINFETAGLYLDPLSRTGTVRVEGRIPLDGPVFVFIPDVGNMHMRCVRH